MIFFYKNKNLINLFEKLNANSSSSEPLLYYLLIKFLLQGLSSDDIDFERIKWSYIFKT